MLRRDLGAFNQDHAPIGGYQQFNSPQYFSEQGYFPMPQRGLSARQLRRAGIVLPEVDIPAPDMGEFESEFTDRPFEETLGNPNLPIAAFREQIKEAVRSNQVTIVVGETGSGKSTQMPQILLEDGYEKITLTQPRRIASYMVSERVQAELDETLGADRARELVGHQTAEKSTVTEKTKIAVITDGIEVNKQLYDNLNDGKTVHILDEVHEWNTNIEFSVGLIRDRLAKDPGAKFVLTSATMDAHRLAAYFSEVTGQAPPVLEVPGRTHPIEKIERDESTVLNEILKSATENPDEDILVFVPGKQEISDTIDELMRRLPPEIKENATILPLHAKLKKEEQDRINLPGKGIKIIVATNVAQTSLTIDGIDVVIDSGLERRIELDGEGVEGLKRFPVSQADCDQRAGRTGRVGPGRYILTRYDQKTDFVPYIARRKFPQAEILRTNLDRTVLRAASVDIDMGEMVLFHAVDPDTIRRSEVALYNLGALDEDKKITPLGKRMNQFPVLPSSARMLMEALPFTPLVQAQLAAIVASREVGGLPYFAHDSGQNWKDLVTDTSSDMLAQLDIFISSQGMTDKELAEYDLDVPNVRRAQELYGKIIRRVGSWEGDLIEPADAERSALKHAIYAGMVNSVYQHAGEGLYERMTGASTHTSRELSRRSVVAGAPRFVVGNPYRVEIMRKGAPEEIHILEGVTILEDPRILGKVAAKHLLSWEPVKHVWREGRLHELQQLVFSKSVRLGEMREVEATPNPRTEKIVVESILEHAGPAQNKLRALKRELEELQRLTAHKIPTLSQDTLIALLQDATAAAGLDQSRVDNELRLLMEERGISLDAIISPEDQESIRKNSPAQLVAGTVKLKLDYHFPGIPVVVNATAKIIEQCGPEVRLPDGREVYFWQGRRRMTLAQVREEHALFTGFVS